LDHLSLPKLLVIRLRNDWKLMVAVFFGMVVATAVASGAPLYLDALNQLDFEASVERLSSQTLTLLVFGPDEPVSESSLQRVESSLAEAIDSNLSSIYLERKRARRGATSLIGLPDEPLPRGGGKGVLLSQGYLQHLSNLEDHSRFIEGRMATDESSLAALGREVEAIIGTGTASRFGLGLEDVVGLSPGIASSDVILAQIVGIFEPSDPEDEYWAGAESILDPPILTGAPPILVQVDPEEPPVTLFVTEATMMRVVEEPAIVAPLGTETFVASAVLLVGLPSNPLPQGGGSGILATLGHFQNLSSLDQNIRLVDGRMARTQVDQTPDGARLEAIVPSQMAFSYELEVGDEVAVAPSLGLDAHITVVIAGTFEQAAPTDEYWGTMSMYLSPAPLVSGDSPPGGPDLDSSADVDTVLASTLGIPLGVQPTAKPPLPLFVTEGAMGRALAATFPGSLAKATWFIEVSTEALKDLSISEARESILGFEEDVSKSIPGADVSAGAIRGLTDEGRRSNLLSSIPLRLQLAVLEAMVLIFLLMMVFHLVEARESDTATLRARGLGIYQLLRLYTFEGLALALVATVAGSLLAIGGVALAGTLPSFDDLTAGDLLPVQISLSPFIFASAIGLLCVLIYVIYGALRAKRGPLTNRFRASRPSPAPFFQRCFLDLAFLAIGGFVFWELRSRGQFVSGGFLKDVEVDETLLVAPVLFLVAAAMVLSRLFPVMVRFLSGESPRLAHLFTAIVLAVVAAGAADDAQDADLGVRVGVVVLLLAVGGAYWATDRARRLPSSAIGLLIQAGFVGAVVALQPPETGEWLLVPTVALILIVPVQLIFALLKATATASPIWLSVALWHMSRNPAQYNWLVFLMVLVTGVAILAATVGETFERSSRDRIQYDVGADIRIRGVDSVAGGAAAVKTQYLSQSGATAAETFRTVGSIRGDRIDVLGVESGQIEAVSWYREDFSDLPLGSVMKRLRSDTPPEPIEIPGDATGIGLWVRPVELKSPMSIGVVLGDSQGGSSFVVLGNITTADWQLVRGVVPPEAGSPLFLASVVTFDGTGVEIPSAGSIMVDNIHVTTGRQSDERILEDFEGGRPWVPISFSTLTTESSFSVEGDAFDGAGAGLFSFGIRTLSGFRGFYPSPSDGPMPVVASSSLGDSDDSTAADRLVIAIGGRWIPIEIAETVEFFPTMDPDQPFILADLEGLQRHLNAFPAQISTNPNELLIKSGPEDSQRLLDGLSALDPPPSEVLVTASLLDNLELDAFTTMAWRPMALLSVGVGLIAAAAGYMAYLLLFVKRSRVEIGSLESLGLSRVQMIASLSFEHLSIAAIGVGVGILAGFQMRSLIVSPLSVTVAGEQVVPPFVMTTDWDLLVPALGILAAVLVVGVLALSGSIRHVDLSAIGRSGDI